MKSKSRILVTLILILIGLDLLPVILGRVPVKLKIVAVLGVALAAFFMARGQKWARIVLMVCALATLITATIEFYDVGQAWEIYAVYIVLNVVLLICLVLARQLKPSEPPAETTLP